jgi:ComF family protein
MLILLNKIVVCLVNFIFPKECYLCGKPGKYICTKCIKNKLTINWEQKCHVCNKPCRMGFVHKDCSETTYLDGLIYITLYDDEVSKVIHDVKYNFNFDVLNEIAVIMANYLKRYKFANDIVLTSVPLHKSKERFRGFNQADLLGKKVGRKAVLQYNELLKRNRKTHTQVMLSKEERSVNLKNVFMLKNKGLKLPKEVIIVDDVYTTGSTLSECTKVLKANGVERVYGLVFARAGG